VCTEKPGGFKIQIPDYLGGEIPALQKIVLSLVVIVVLCASGFADEISDIEDLGRFRLDQ
jgi:hypothetical protein